MSIYFFFLLTNKVTNAIKNIASLANVIPVILTFNNSNTNIDLLRAQKQGWSVLRCLIMSSWIYKKEAAAWLPPECIALSCLRCSYFCIVESLHLWIFIVRFDHELYWPDVRWASRCSSIFCLKCDSTSDRFISWENKGYENSERDHQQKLQRKQI